MRAQCIICTDSFDREKEIAAMPCGHTFHEPCLSKWLSRSKGSCPQCRKSLSAREKPIRLFFTEPNESTCAPDGASKLKTMLGDCRVPPQDKDRSPSRRVGAVARPLTSTPLPASPRATTAQTRNPFVPFGEQGSDHKRRHLTFTESILLTSGEESDEVDAARSPPKRRRLSAKVGAASVGTFERTQEHGVYHNHYYKCNVFLNDDRLSEAVLSSLLPGSSNAGQPWSFRDHPRFTAAAADHGRAKRDLHDTVRRRERGSGHDHVNSTSGNNR